MLHNWNLIKLYTFLAQTKKKREADDIMFYNYASEMFFGVIWEGNFEFRMKTKWHDIKGNGRKLPGWKKKECIRFNFTFATANSYQQNWICLPLFNSSPLRFVYSHSIAIHFQMAHSSPILLLAAMLIVLIANYCKTN